MKWTPGMKVGVGLLALVGGLFAFSKNLGELALAGDQAVVPLRSLKNPPAGFAQLPANTNLLVRVDTKTKDAITGLVVGTVTGPKEADILVFPDLATAATVTAEDVNVIGLRRDGKVVKGTLAPLAA